MVNLSYRFPNDIPIHFFGETQIPMTECMKRKKRYQFICFMVFHMVEQAEKKVGRFTITETSTYNRMRILLSDNGRLIFEVIEDCFSEWIIKMAGNEEDILDFSAEYIQHLLCPTYTENNLHTRK